MSRDSVTVRVECAYGCDLSRNECAVRASTGYPGPGCWVSWTESDVANLDLTSGGDMGLVGALGRLLSEHQFESNTRSKPQERRTATNSPIRVSQGGSEGSGPENGTGGRE